MPSGAKPTVLHYTGYEDDGSGILSTVRALAATGRFDCLLGVNPGFAQKRAPVLPVLELPRIAGETISAGTFLRARSVARAAQAWLQADAARVFHGHSRAGLLVVWWLHHWGERRVLASVHCYGRQRWFYRWLARQLGSRLFWLSPAMRNHFGLPEEGRRQCVPECVVAPVGLPRPSGAGKLRLGGAGMLVRWKRWDLILEAMARLPAEIRGRVDFQHIGAAIANDDSVRYAAELSETTARLGLAAQVRWCGAEPSSARLLGETDVLVVASQNEPMSLVMLEALAAGLPVLAADSGGALDVIQPGVNGWRFRTDDAADLARRLTSLAANPAAARLDAAALRGSVSYAADIAPRWAEIYAAL